MRFSVIVFCAACLFSGSEGLEISHKTAGANLDQMSMLQAQARVHEIEEGNLTATYFSGVRVYNYEAAFEGVAETDRDKHSWDWVVVFPWYYTGIQFNAFCGGFTCTYKGHPLLGGIPMVVFHGTRVQLKEALADHPGAEFVEPDQTLEMAAADEPMWNLERMYSTAPDTATAYDPGLGGAGVHVYVLDSGIDCTHPQFEGRCIPTLEVSRAGFKHAFKECEPNDFECAKDEKGHGTHVAGIVGSKDYGVAPKATIHAVEFMGKKGNAGAGLASLASMVAIIDWVITRGQKPAVITVSVSKFMIGRDRLMEEAAKKSMEAGIVVTVSAGNQGDDAEDYLPAKIKEFITVGGTDQDDNSKWNYGKDVDIFAPSIAILSLDLEHRTKVRSGTSMAAPHMAGAVARYISEHGLISSPAQIKDDLIECKSLKGHIKMSDKGIAAGTPNKLLHLAPRIGCN